MKIFTRSVVLTCAVLVNAAIAWHPTTLFAQTPGAGETPTAKSTPPAKFACEDDWSSGNLQCKTGWCGKGGQAKVCSNTGEYKNPKDPNDPENGKPTCVCIAAPPPSAPPPAPPPKPVDPNSKCSSREQCGGTCYQVSVKNGLIGAAFGDKVQGTCQGTAGKDCSCVTGQAKDIGRDAVNGGIRALVSPTASPLGGFFGR